MSLPATTVSRSLAATMQNRRSASHDTPKITLNRRRASHNSNRKPASHNFLPKTCQPHLLAEDLPATASRPKPARHVSYPKTCHNNTKLKICRPQCVSGDMLATFLHWRSASDNSKSQKWTQHFTEDPSASLTEDLPASCRQPIFKDHGNLALLPTFVTT